MITCNECRTILRNEFFTVQTEYSIEYYCDEKCNNKFTLRTCINCFSEYQQLTTAIDPTKENYCSDCDNPFEFDENYWMDRP